VQILLLYGQLEIRELKRVMWDFATGVTVVTTRLGNAIQRMTLFHVRFDINGSGQSGEETLVQSK
jgi:hypothetical protein